MQSISLSTIVLTYNQQDTVEESVASVLSQDVQPMEIVITDDCSPDGTFDAIQRAVAGYDGPHTVILNRNPTNLGLAGNLEKAHALSTGDIIIAAAGDDIFYPNRSQRILETFLAEDPLLVCSHAKVIDPEGTPLPGDFLTALFYRSPWTIEQAARSKSLYIGATGAWHRTLYTDYGPIDPESYEDLVLGFRAALMGRVAVIEEELVQYRLGSGITSSDGYDANMAVFENRRRKGFVAQRAVMRQRIKDAKRFGLDETSAVLRVLNREMAKAAIGVSYYDTAAGSFRSQFLRHPLLGLYTLRSERRRKRKLLRQLRAKSG